MNTPSKSVRVVHLVQDQHDNDRANEGVHKLLVVDVGSVCANVFCHENGVAKERSQNTFVSVRRMVGSKP